MNGPSFPVGDAGEPGGTLSADGGSDSGGGTVTDAGDAGDDAGTDPGPFPLGATWGTNAVHFRVRADAAT
ncbi:MAG: hypothetical protein ACLQVI_34085, partial [Polyangiaceae bacterium]